MNQCSWFGQKLYFTSFSSNYLSRWILLLRAFVQVLQKFLDSVGQMVFRFLYDQFFQSAFSFVFPAMVVYCMLESSLHTNNVEKSRKVNGYAPFFRRATVIHRKKWTDMLRFSVANFLLAATCVFLSERQCSVLSAIVAYRIPLSQQVNGNPPFFWAFFGVFGNIERICSVFQAVFTPIFGSKVAGLNRSDWVDMLRFRHSTLMLNAILAIDTSERRTDCLARIRI